MKRKYMDRLDWKRILKSRYSERFIDNNLFKGYLSLFYIDEVIEPLIVNLNSREYTLADNGFKWMQHVPLDTKYSVTTMIDKNNNIIQWYFDIIKGIGIEESRVFYDDLYLDIVHLPSHKTILLDEDELKEALENKLITNDDYKLAYIEAEKVQLELARGQNHFVNTSEMYFNNMIKQHT